RCFSGALTYASKMILCKKNFGGSSCNLLSFSTPVNQQNCITAFFTWIPNYWSRTKQERCEQYLTKSAENSLFTY
ncbi:MAG: hypothetical protein QXT73_07170, partial [Candidatus Methanomethylicaceae archaeon]